MNPSSVERPKAICNLQSVICNLQWSVLLLVAAASAFADSTSAPTSFPGKYVVASIAVPGLGEMWSGSRAKGEAFLWTDAAIWLTWGGLTAIGGKRDHAARLYAADISGASSTVRDDDYYVNLERYPNSDLFNDDVRRDAREMYPDDPAKQRLYIDSHSIGGDSTWRWGSDSLRVAYWTRRKDARSLLHTAGFFLGAALLNRLASAVDVAFFTPTPKTEPSQTLRRINLVPTFDQPGLALHYRF